MPKNKLDAVASSAALTSSPDASASRAASPKAPPADTTDWNTSLRAYGKANALAGKRSRYDDATLIAGELHISALPTENPTLTAALAHEALGSGYFTAMGALATELANLIKQTPPKMSAWELLPPPQKAMLEQVGQEIRDARDLVFDLAIDIGREEDAKALGRGLVVGNSPESIRAAGRKFLSGAVERMPLLVEARVTQATLDSISAGLAKLDTITVVKGERQQEKVDLGSDRAVLERSIIVGFSFLRNRIKAAFKTDQTGRDTALRNIPRAPDRRAAEPVTPPAAKRKKLTLKEKAAEKRAKKADRIAKRKAAAEQKAAAKLAAKALAKAPPAAKTPANG